MKQMKTVWMGILILSGLFLAVASCSKDSNYQPAPVITDVPPKSQSTIVQAAGDISTALKQFRHIAGDSLNSKPDANPFGRREINWDAVPSNLTNTKNFPLDFFNATDPDAPNARKRGMVLSGGNSFQVDSTNFSSIESSYVKDFQAFSPKKTFAYLGNTVTQLSFRVPGLTVEASVKAFGVVFSDVDLDGFTSIEFFDGDESLGLFKVPASKGDGSFSFLGVFFPLNTITRVRITAGNALLAPGVKDISDGGTKDLVVMDDFLYSEPKSLGLK